MRQPPKGSALDLAQGVFHHLAALPLAKVRPGVDGEIWCDHRCRFHPDAHQSASFEMTSGVYYCRTEDRTYPLEEVVAVLAGEATLPAAAPSTNGHRRGAAAVDTPLVEGPVEIYPYVFPDGRLSHVKYRWDLFGPDGSYQRKRIQQRGAGGEFSLPADTWPVYGDEALERGTALVVVEGERKVNRIAAIADAYAGHPIRGLTCGSASDLTKNARTLASRLGELEPAHILLWPDNDEPGLRAMLTVSRALREQGLVHEILKPSAYKLPRKGDVVDYLDQEGSLRVVFADHFGSGGRIEDLIDQVRVVAPGYFIYPRTRTLERIDLLNVQTLTWRELGYLPNERETKQIYARLKIRSIDSPTQVRTRYFSNSDATWWRPHSEGRCYRIDGAGVEHDDDPEGVVITVPPTEPLYPVEVDLAGSRADLEEVCRIFKLTGTEIAMIEGWLVAALCGLQTPILLMRGPAGTGKSTLARLILGVLEPTCPEMTASSERMADLREFHRYLQATRGILLDNVSRLSDQWEDTLSRLVTGYTTGIRALYADSAETLRLQAGVIITTTNWDVYKGDLASRIVVVQPQTEAELSWYSDRDIRERLSHLVPRIRGYLFSLAQAYYANRDRLAGARNVFRVGDLGVIFACLGYDVAELAHREAIDKAEVISTNDLWLEALVDMWKAESEGVIWFSKSTKEIIKHFHEYGVENLPADKSPKFARWVQEKNPIMRDHGFQMESYRTADFRGYKFRRSSPLGEAVISEPAPPPRLGQLELGG